MKKDDLWAALIVKRPTLADPEAKIEFIVKNLRALLNQVWDQGYKDGAGVAKQMQALLNSFEKDKDKSAMSSMLDKSMRSSDPMKAFMEMMEKGF